MTPAQKAWLIVTAGQAYSAQHIYPRMAACEAALESAFGTSMLAKMGNNLFGMKQHLHPTFGSVSLPTEEFLDAQWQRVNADWVKYPAVQDCFADRMATLRRLQDAYPHYQAALSAPDSQTYIVEVSKTWSTDPNRAAKVQAIYDEAFPPAAAA